MNDYRGLARASGSSSRVRKTLEDARRVSFFQRKFKETHKSHKSGVSRVVWTISHETKRLARGLRAIKDIEKDFKE